MAAPKRPRFKSPFPPPKEYKDYLKEAGYEYKTGIGYRSKNQESYKKPEMPTEAIVRKSICE